MVKRAFALLLAASLSASAELSPEVYREMQRKAPELVQVQITAAAVDREWSKPRGCPLFEFEVASRVVLTAKVIKVVRSASGIRAGSVVRLEYTSLKQCSGWSGPGPIAVMKKGDRVYAFLARGTGAYEPAAGRASFSVTQP